MFESSRAVKSPSLRSPRTDRLFWKLLTGVSVFLLTPEASLGSFFGLRSACSKGLESSPESEASSNAAKRRILNFPSTGARATPPGPAALILMVRSPWARSAGGAYVIRPASTLTRSVTSTPSTSTVSVFGSTPAGSARVAAISGRRSRSSLPGSGVCAATASGWGSPGAARGGRLPGRGGGRGGGGGGGRGGGGGGRRGRRLGPALDGREGDETRHA